MTESSKWKMDRTVPVAFLLGLIGQTFFLGWFVATQTGRITALEKGQVTSERVARIEEQYMSLRDVVVEIKSDIKRLLDQRLVEKKS